VWVDRAWRVEAGDEHTLAGVLEARQCPDQAPGGVRQQVDQPGVSVGGQRFNREIDVEQAAHAKRDHGVVLGVDASLLPDGAVGAQAISLGLFFVRLNP